MEHGEVWVRRRIAWGLKAHTWVIYKTGDMVYLIDSTLPHSQQIYNLKEPLAAQAALAIYAKKERGLEGILFEIFAENDLEHLQLNFIPENSFKLMEEKSSTTEKKENESKLHER